MNKKFITVVFEYEDGAELPARITAAFAKNEAFHGVKISAVSLEDEITRVEQLEEQLA
ncbi:hypothetical protein GCM10011607_12670 [Shewanella inventionis]|uniref:Uncharacterized protein n=1 Tax=Shewanella inventionis TaxID=1738770 RepID=A0ABQ1IXG4_9GAMM|nr:hypothetical protein [Shewanella inventionis]GGB53573.1 hypothetical protein GCM10011607_12670 [Shewanella inventionis]